MALEPSQLFGHNRPSIERGGASPHQHRCDVCKLANPFLCALFPAAWLLVNMIIKAHRDYNNTNANHVLK